jgi:hypothetical protein
LANTPKCTGYAASEVRAEAHREEVHKEGSDEMTDRELLEKFYAEFSDFRTNTEANFTRVFSDLARIDKRFDKLDHRIDLVMEEPVSFKIMARDRLDRLEKEKIEQ